MKTYINSLIASVLISQIALCLSPSKSDGKKYVGFICSVFVLLTMLSPVKAMIGEIPDTLGGIKDYFTDVPEEKTEPDGFSSAAATLLAYIAEEYPSSASGASLTFVTGEDGKIREVQFYLPNADRNDCARIRHSLSGVLTVDVYVFGSDETRESTEQSQKKG